MKDKQTYISLFEYNKPKVPIFYWPEWLEAVSFGNWDMAIYEENSEILAVLPILKKTKYGLSAIYNPLLSPYQGIYFLKELDLKESKKNSKKYKIITHLLDKVPDSHYSLVSFHHSFDYAMPLIHRNYSTKLSYSYILDNIKDHELTFSNFKSSLKNKIRKGEQNLRIEQVRDINLIYDQVKNSFERQELKLGLSLSFVKRLFDSIPNNFKILVAKDQADRIHAAHALIWDDLYAYNLLLGGDTKLRSSGAIPFLLWHSIKVASEKVDQYDFEGSTLTSVQPFFESFGGKAIPHFIFQKASNNILRSLLYAFNRFK